MAYALDGSSQFLKTASAPAENVPITLFAHFYPERATVFETIVGLYPDTDSKGTIIVVYNRGDITGDPVTAEYRGAEVGSVASAQSSSAAAQGAWNIAAGVFAALNSRSIFLNQSGAVTNSLSRGAAVAEAFVIGAQSRNPSTAGYLLGRVAEAAIWSAALTDAEIASLAKGFKPTRIRPQSLVFYAPLLRNLQDLKGGLALTNNNGATVADHPRVY